MDYQRLIQKARESKFEFQHPGGTWSFTIRRPTARQLERYFRMPDDEAKDRLVIDCVVDWNLTGQDLLPAVGVSEAVPFHRGAWEEFVGDRPALLEAVAMKVVSLVNAHIEEVKAAAGTEDEPGKSAST